MSAESDQFGPGDQICCGQDDFEPGGIGVEGLARQVTQAGGFEFADAVLHAGVLAVTQLEPGKLSGDDAGGGVGEKRGHAHTVGVGEPQLRSRVGALFAQDQPVSGRPTAEVNQICGLGDPRPVPHPAIGVDRGIPTVSEVEGVDGVLHAGIDGVPEREPHTGCWQAAANAWVAPAESQRTSTRGGSGSPGTVRPIGRPLERLLQDGDVVSGGVGAGVAGPEQPGQRLAAADLRSIEERQQGVMAESLLPGRCRVLLGIGMIDDQRGVDIDMQPFPGNRGGPGIPRLGSGRHPGSTHPRQVRRIDALIDQPPHRGRRRRRPEHMFAIPTQLPDPINTVRPVSDRGGQISEDSPGRIHPRAAIGIRQHRSDPR